MRSGALGWTRWFAVSAAIVVADLATKAWVSHVFQTGDSLEITPFFNLVLAHNTGAAFSFLAGAGGWQRWFFTIVTIVISAGIVVMLARRPGRWVSAALALVLGGALGNLFDRLTLGHVIDFITAGVVMLVWDSLKPRAGGLAAGAKEKP